MPLAVAAALAVALVSGLCLGAPTAARAGPTATPPAGQTVTLQTGFDPDRLGVRTTIEFSFQIHSALAGRAPTPVTEIDLHLPGSLGLATSTLGLANCEPARLLAQGLAGCPANARIGVGSAFAAVPEEGEPVQEEGSLTALVGQPNSEHLEVLFYAEAHRPVSAQLVLPGQVLGDSPPFSGRLDTTVPLIPTWPGGPDVAVTSMRSTIGPLGLTYYRHVGGRIVPFKPRGIEVPKDCPRGGFPFRVDLTFLDGTHASATSSVPCP